MLEEVSFIRGNQNIFRHLLSFHITPVSEEQSRDAAAPPCHATRPEEEEISNCSVARHGSTRQEVKITVPD